MQKEHAGAGFGGGIECYAGLGPVGKEDIEVFPRLGDGGRDEE
jgi:hypothetical protein